MNYILSIIIPVYNTENYVEECFDSVFSQISDVVEIIIIDDGTPDRSVEIIKSKYAKWLASDQVVLIEQSNAGPGAARNSGLAVARGEYIGFLDSDDVILEEFFHTVLSTLKSYKPGVVEFGFQRFHKLIDIDKENYQSVYSFKGMCEVERIRNEVFSVGIWFPSTRVYKRELFESIRMPVGVFYEDLMTIPYIYLKNISLYFIDQPLIGYRFNPNSTTAVHTKSNARDLYQFYMSLSLLENSTPVEILKIKTARGIAYFFNELGPLNIPIAAVIEDIKKIRKGFVLLNNLKFPDLFFFLLPDYYMQFDKFRLTKLKRKLK
ncbi:MAG: glycosyltransferase involved in cell wall biosynthesis [Flavobacterium sp.]|jgi:glycosyltransferase involved in cell wall biosynthesis